MNKETQGATFKPVSAGVGKGRLGAGTLIAVATVACALAPSAGADETVRACAAAPFNTRGVLGPGSTYGINYYDYCSQGSAQGLELLGDGVNSIPAGKAATWTAFAPSGLLIARGQAANYSTQNVAGTGFVASFNWQGGGARLSNGGVPFDSGPISSAFFQAQLACAGYQGTASCPQSRGQQPDFYSNSITLQVHETAPPAVSAEGANNLLYEGRAGQWVRGGGWPISFAADSASGVCNMIALVNNQAVQGPTGTADQTAWKQCPAQNWPKAITPGSFGQGAIPLVLAAGSAAGNIGSATATVYVDDAPPTVSLASADAPDQSVWIGHAATVTATASAGPSGVSGITCNGQAYPGPGPASVRLDGDGAHTLTCTSSNRAIDTTGQDAGSTPASYTAKIDEAPPKLSIEASDPADPQKLVADTGDAESGVASVSWKMRPHLAGAFQDLPTQFDGSHALARFDDSQVPANSYDFLATSCDQVGNCATAEETLALPVRTAAVSAIGFTSISAPARVVTERVRIGGHIRRVRRHGKTVRVSVGGHVVRVRLVIGRGRACAHKRIRIGRHKWRVISACRKLIVKTNASERVPFGRAVTVQGALMSAQGVGIANAPVEIDTAPTSPGNPAGAFTVAGPVTTNAAGQWSATLPAGPTRTIRAEYAGSSTVLPATGQATAIVPARIRVLMAPRILPWSETLRIRGQMLGGNVPADGVALRLLTRLPGSRRETVLLAFRTDARGRFRVGWSFHLGSGAARLPMWVATTSNESDYPYAASASQHIGVLWGRRTPHRHRR